MNNSETALIVGIFAALLGFLVNIFATLHTRKSEDKIKFRETVYKSALDHRAQDMKNLENNKDEVVGALSLYLIHAVKVCEAMPNAKITGEQFEKKLDELEPLLSNHIKKLESGK